MIDLAPSVQAEIVEILRRRLGQTEVRLVGSRARGPAKRYADVDLLIMNPRPLPPLTRALLRTDFEESDIPYKVDLVEWADLSQPFRRRLEKESVRLM